MAKQKMCYTCRTVFPRSELIDYAAPGTTTIHSYCEACYQEKLNKEKFSNKVCQIFGIKSPGPLIWTQRLKLKNDYGYTDDIIVQCLEYIYNIKKMKKLKESLGLITPYTIEEMKKYNKNQAYKSNMLLNAIKQPKSECQIEIKENIQSTKNDWNPDDWLEDSEEI